MSVTSKSYSTWSNQVFRIPTTSPNNDSVESVVVQNIATLDNGLSIIKISTNEKSFRTCIVCDVKYCDHMVFSESTATFEFIVYVYSSELRITFRPYHATIWSQSHRIYCKLVVTI
ncbi:hypothetical protein ABKN59_005132 [Abortiporus biennis]